MSFENQSFLSLTQTHSYEQQNLRRIHNSSSFVLVNNTRSWRPPPSLVHNIVAYMPSRTPIAFVVANPGVRLYSERSARSGFQIDNYSISVPRGDWELHKGKEEPHLVEDDCADYDDEDKVDRLTVFPFGTSDYSHFRKWNDHSYPKCGFKQRAELVTLPQWIDTEVNCCAHLSRSNDNGQLSSSLPFRSPELGEIEHNMCLQGASAEISLCVSVLCKSAKGIEMAARSMWWLSRYFGVSLTLEGMRAGQASAFKGLREKLSIKELKIAKSVLTEHWLQVISSCADLLSLSIVNSTSCNNIEMQQVNPILSSNKQKRDKSGWYLAGMKSLGLLSKLRCLHLVNTSITPEFLSSLEQCHSIQCIVFQKVKGVGSLKSFTALPSLTCVGLVGCFFEDGDARHLGDCASLTHLFVEDCRKVTNIKFVESLQKLTCLSIGRNNLSDTELVSLQSCTSLKELHMNSLRRLNSLSFLAPLTQLETLSIADNTVTLAGTMGLQLLKHITRVQMSGCRYITSVNLWLEKKETHSLVSLDLSKSGIESAGLTFLRYSPNLRYLNLADCPHVTSLPFLDLELEEENLPPFSLRWLSLASTPVTNEGLKNLFLLTNLSFLCLKGCLSVSSLDFLTKLQKLRYLDLGETQVNDDALPPVGLCHRLRFLSVENCTGVTSLAPLAGLNALCELDLSFSGVNDAGLAPITHFPNLEVVFVRGCAEIENLRILSSIKSLNVVVADRRSFRADAHARRRSFSYDDEEKLSLLRPSPPQADKSKRPTRPSTSVPSSRRARQRPEAVSASHNESPFTLEKKNSFSTTMQISGLVAVTFRKCVLNDHLLQEMVSLNEFLVMLDVRECGTLTDLTALRHLKYLVVLTASGTSVHNSGVEEIGACLSLEKVSLAGCHAITSLKGLSKLRHLKEINVSRTEVTNEGLNGLSTCHALQTVLVSECKYLSDLNALASLPFLSELHAEATPITSAGVKQLSMCTALERVYFTKCSQLEDLLDLTSCWPQLEMLDTYGTAIPSRTVGQPKQCACCVM